MRSVSLPWRSSIRNGTSLGTPHAGQASSDDPDDRAFGAGRVAHGADDDLLCPIPSPHPQSHRFPGLVQADQSA